LGRPCSGWRNGQFYNLCRIVLATMSTCAYHPQCVAHAGPETIGPLYHPTGSRCSWLAGLTRSDDLDLTDMPDTQFQGAPLAAAEWPAARFARHLRHLRRTGRLPGNTWGRASLIGPGPSPSASLPGVVGCVTASCTSYCLQTVCDVRRVVISERSVLLVGCCICKSRKRCKMSQRHRSESESSSSSSEYH